MGREMAYSETELNRLISQRFNVRLMSDAKWDRLLESLLDVFVDGLFIYNKLVYDDTVSSHFLIDKDFKPFFKEPTFYKELEWIEFPRVYEDYVSKDNYKAGKKNYKQDIERVAKVIKEIGQFELEQRGDSLRLYGYK